MDRLWKLIFGYVTIQAEGMMLERFVNACESARVPLTGMKRASRLRLVANVRAHHHKRLLRIAEQTHCTVTVLSHHGIHALIRRLAVRPVLIAFLVLALVAGTLSTQFVVDVRISGVTGERAEQMLKAAKALGASRWALWSTLNQSNLQQSLEQNVPFAQKVLVHKYGTMMDIEVIPYVEGPALFKKGDVCDIVAGQSAVVESVVALDGTPSVQKGDVVRVGDVLIRGTFERNSGEGKQRFVQARGIVIGRVGYMGQAKVSLTTQTYVKTGREESVRTISIAGWKIPLSAGTTFEQSVLVKQNEEPIVNSVLPASVVTKTYAEIRTISREQTYAEAEAAGIAYARLEAQSKMPLHSIAVQQTVCSSLTEDGYVEVCVYLTALMPIGVENKQMITDPLLYIPKYW